MKQFTIWFFILLLQACASTSSEQVAEARRAVPQANTMKPIELYSERYFLDFEQALNQQAEAALTSKTNLQQMIKYFAGSEPLSATAAKNLNWWFTKSSKAFIKGITETPGIEWLYIASKQSTDDSFISYYRATNSGQFVYYELTWLNGSIVDVVNLGLGAGISSSFDFLLERGREEFYSKQALASVDQFFSQLQRSQYTQMVHSYERMPRQFQQHDLVLGALFKLYNPEDSAELPIGLTKYLEKQKPIQARYFSYYYQQKQYDLALACLAAYPEPVVRDGRIQVEIAYLHYLLGEATLAESLLVDNILTQPYQAYAYIVLLELSLAAGQNEQAELLLKVLHDRFSVTYTKPSLLSLKPGNSFVKTVNYQRYAEYIN